MKFETIPNPVAWFIALIALTTSIHARDVDLERIMSDPDWIGPPVEAAWWQLDGQSYVYRAKRVDSIQRDLFRVDIDSGTIEPIEAVDQSALDGESPIFDASRSRALSIRNGNLFLRTLDDGTLIQLTGDGGTSDARFGAGASTIHFRRSGRWWRMNLVDRVARPVADLKFEDDPNADPEDPLEAHQLDLFATLERERQRQRELQQDAIDASRMDPTRGPEPWYLGVDYSPAGSELSADGRWLLVTVEKAGAKDGKSDAMPRFVTRSGYVEIEDVRTLVGRDGSTPQQLWLLDLETRTRHELDLSALPGIADDPLAELKAERDIEPHDEDNPRPLRIAAIEWHDSDARAAVQLRAIDNKDRWTILVNAPDQQIETVHRLTDPGWINWAFNEFGWIPDSDSVWLLSEESGYSHLHVADSRGRTRQVTEGDFEVFDVQIAGDGRSALVLSNRAHPTEYDLYRVDMDSGDFERLTEMKGVESYALGANERLALVRHSETYVPAQAVVVDLSDGTRRAATDTRTGDYRAIDWQAPEFVGIESAHGAGAPIWTKFYPARGEHEGRRPAVLFVHGAGYTQNTHHRFPYYFREQMFHTLLTARGYHVLDMDYRASRGYGRDWRTAIYRQMGTPELKDLIDGVDWLVEQHGANPERVGLYGGSYGGFMAFMALFNAPEVFRSGAALRPVTDWAHYNHPYTANILNTPDIDPEAYARSSPIEFAEGLQGHLLMTHGMLDDNVFYQDVARLAQRLIELEKEHWELASYPLEGHGFRRPSSWLDQYRRILTLFERTIGEAP